jgi:hypothetical protein
MSILRRYNERGTVPSDYFKIARGFEERGCRILYQGTVRMPGFTTPILVVDLPRLNSKGIYYANSGVLEEICGDVRSGSFSEGRLIYDRSCARWDEADHFLNDSDFKIVPPRTRFYGFNSDDNLQGEVCDPRVEYRGLVFEHQEGLYVLHRKRTLPRHDNECQVLSTA